MHNEKVLLLTTEQAAEYLSLSASTLHKLRCSGGGPAYRVLGARAVRYSQCDLDAWVADRVRHSTAENTRGTREIDR